MLRGRIGRTRIAPGQLRSNSCGIKLDFKKDPAEIVSHLLEQMTRADVSKFHKLGCYNAFVRLWHRSGSQIRLSYSHEDIAVCLRQGLFSQAKEVRAACLRSFRYFCCDTNSLNAMLKLHIDYLVTRSLDICLDNEIERLHAMRLIRKIMSVSPQDFPSSLLNVMVSIANDGNKERDKLAKACLESICELALLNPNLAIRHGGVSTILKNILDCHQLPRISESLVATIMVLLNSPETRSLITPKIDLSLVMAPFTDYDYKFGCDVDEHSGEGTQFHYDSCKMALSAMVKSWSGLFQLCMPECSGLKSLIGMLHLPNDETRKEIIDVLYDIFRLCVPKWTDSFAEAFLSIDMSDVNDIWQLSEGFVAEEGKCLLPNLAKTRPNLIDNHTAFLLSMFVKAGLYEALIEILCTSGMFVCVRTTILMGQLLHLGNSCLPDNRLQDINCLPGLIQRAANFGSAESYRAKVAISCLKQMNDAKSHGPVQYSLYLRHLLYCTEKKTASSSFGSSVYMNSVEHERDCETANDVVRDSHVLYTKDNCSWNWQLISTILRCPDDTMKKLEDASSQRFIQRLLFLFKPSNKIYSLMELTREDQLKITVAGLDFIEFLVKSETEFAEKSVNEFVKDISECLSEVVEPSAGIEGLFAASNLLHTCSQFYFLFIGHLCTIDKGKKVVDESGIFQLLLKMMCSSTHELYVKMIISCLDYTCDGPARTILLQALTNTSEHSRLYATRFLRVLLRIMPSADFSQWGIKLMTGQLRDNYKLVVFEALSFLSEASEDPVHLESILQLDVTVSNLGFKGDLLVARFMSTEKGFHTLFESGIVDLEFSKWNMVYNMRYVETVEERICEALTTYEKTFDGSFTRRSHRRLPRKNVFVPIHLYGQLVQHESGTKYLASQPYLKEMFDILRVTGQATDLKIKQLKSVLWAMGHIGRSLWGIELLFESGVIPCIISLVESSSVFSIRGTAFYVVGMLASTKRGADILVNLGWETVCHARNTADITRTDNTGLTSLSSEREVISNQQPTSFIIASDLEFSGFMRRSNQNASCSRGQRSQLSGVSEGQNTSCSQGSSWQRSQLSGVSECHSDNSYETDFDVSVCKSLPAQHVSDIEYNSGVSASSYVLPTELDDGNVSNDGMLSSVCDVGGNIKQLSMSNTESTARSSFTLPMSNTESTVRSSFTLPMSNTESTARSSFTLPMSNTESTARSSFTLPMSNTESTARSSFTLPMSNTESTVRSSFTLPHMICHEDELQQNNEKTTKHLTSAQDLSGYMKLRDLHPLTAISVTPHHFNSYADADADSYKSKSLDFRVSRLRSSLRSFMTKSSFRDKGLSTGATSLRSHKMATSHDRLSLYETATLSNTLLSSQDKLITLVPSKYGQAEYIGISLPLDITRLFEASRVENIASDTNLEQSLKLSMNYDVDQKSLDVPSQSTENDGYCSDQHNADGCLGCYQIYRQQANGDIDCVVREFSTVHREIVRLIVKMSSSVGVKNCEQSLLILKQKFVSSFSDVCLYSEICIILANYNYRLNSRRFIQELFQDVDFRQCFVDPHYLCGIPKHDIPAETYEHIESEFS